MEELINNMQTMFKKIKKDDENDIYLYFSPKYSPKVKISDWFLPLEAEPKDNDPYHPPGGNYFLSTYKRFGTEVIDMETTTQTMLRQICSPQLNLSVYKPMITAACGQLVAEEGSCDFEGPLCGKVDFTTTYDYDYRHPSPYKKIYSKRHQEKPDRRFGLTSNFIPSKICETKFLDDAEFYNNKPVLAPKLVPPYETHDDMVC